VQAPMRTLRCWPARSIMAHLLEQLQQQHAQRVALFGEARTEGMDVDAEPKSDLEG